MRTEQALGEKKGETRRSIGQSYDESVNSAAERRPVLSDFQPGKHGTADSYAVIRRFLLRVERHHNRLQAAGNHPRVMAHVLQFSSRGSSHIGQLTLTLVISS